MAADNRAIVYIGNSTGLTGAFKSLGYVIDRLKQDRKIALITPDEEFASSHIDGVDHYEIRFREISRSPAIVLYPFILLRNSFRVLKILSRYEDPILHVNDIYNLTGCIVKALRPRVSLVYHVRLLPTSYIGSMYPFFSRMVMRYADRVICCSESVSSALPNDKKKTVIYDAMTIPCAGKVDKSNPPFIIYPANYIEGKGHETALEIFTQICEYDDRLILKFYGDTLHRSKNIDFKEKLKVQASNLGILNRVEFNGFSENISYEIEQATFLLNCSESESFSMICLEGLYLGTPVVTLDSGGPSEIVFHNRTGLIYGLNESAQIIARDMVDLLNQPEKYKYIRSEGKSFARNNFSIEDSVRSIEELYSQI